MAVDKIHISESGVYFITFTNYRWLPLFDMTGSYDLVYQWFEVLKKAGHDVLGYVIMPNHIHVLIGFKIAPKGSSINTIVGNGKRYMAYGIVKRLVSAEKTTILEILEKGVSASDRKKGQLHVAFQESFDLKVCTTLKFVKQKLDYIHSNPVSKKWNLAPTAMDYVHSSAGFYETGKRGLCDVVHVNDWIAEHWNTFGRYPKKEV